MGITEENIVPKWWDIVLDMGLKVLEGKIKSVHEQKELQEKLEKYLSRKLRENLLSSREEEIDFEGLADYIRSELIVDMQTRLFGSREERNFARLNILRKSVVYAQAHTKLSIDRVERMVTSLMDLLKYFYQKKIPREMRLVAGIIVDDLEEHQKAQTDTITKSVTETKEMLAQEIRTQGLLSADRNIELLQKGNYAEVEQNVTAAIRAIGSLHPLNPYYRIGIRTIDGREEFFSCPTVKNMPKEYAPKLKVGVRATLDGEAIKKFDTNCLNHSYRHQIPVILNVVEARKLLGDQLDPYQHEAEREVGKQYQLYPPKFPPAFPCSMLGDNHVIIDYLLLRTREILDDGTYIVTNQEQTGFPAKVEFQFNDKKNIFYFHITAWNGKTEEKLFIAKVIKDMTESKVIKLYSFKHGVILASGNMRPANCSPIFDSISEDIAFFEKLEDIEKYFKKEITLPNPIQQDDISTVDYIASLIRGERCESCWSEFSVDFEVSQRLKESVETEERTQEFCIMLSGTVSISLWGQIYEIPIKRTFPYAAIKNKDSINRKLQVLDLGDPIKLSYVPGETGNVMWDELDSGSIANDTPIPEIL